MATEDELVVANITLALLGAPRIVELVPAGYAGLLKAILETAAGKPDYLVGVDLADVVTTFAGTPTYNQHNTFTERARRIALLQDSR